MKVNIVKGIDVDKLDNAINSKYDDLKDAPYFIMSKETIKADDLKGVPYLIMSKETIKALAEECGAYRLNREDYASAYRGCPIAEYEGLDFGEVEIR